MPEEKDDIQKEIERIQKEVEKATEEPTSVATTCSICNLAFVEEINDYYILNERNIDLATKLIENKYKLKFKASIIEDHFKNHVDQSISKFSIEKKNKLKELTTKAYSPMERNTNRIILIQQIAWDFMLDIYTNKKEALNSKEDRNMHISQSKQFVELAKMYREYHQMQLEIIGMGKTEEEQKQMMENYVANTLKRALEVFDDNPAAKQKLADWLNMAMNPEFNESEDGKEDEK
jgi:hypothetical protein